MLVAIALGALALASTQDPAPSPGNLQPRMVWLAAASDSIGVAEPAPAPAKVSAVATGGDKPAAQVLGFRSAHFGMSEDEVRAAISKDFGKGPDGVRAEDNLGEQTHVLSVLVPDILPGGGTAQVAYVFGYKTKKLIQVALSWSKATDQAITPERLFSNANILRAHFLEAGYSPDTIATNAVVANGLIMFRGSDPADHTTILLLQGTSSQAEDGRRVVTPNALLLFYLADAKNPDIFRLPPGQF